MNDALTESLSQVVESGWANKSGGNLGHPFGRFAMVTISPNEISELYAAVFNDDHTESATLQPGCYVVHEMGSNQLAFLFSNEVEAEAAYQRIANRYADAACEGDGS
jgi:hypothetical protein